MHDLMITIKQILTPEEDALWYMEYCGWTQKEIAILYGVSQKTISKRLKIIKEKLRKWV